MFLWCFPYGVRMGYAVYGKEKRGTFVELGVFPSLEEAKEFSKQNDALAIVNEETDEWFDRDGNRISKPRWKL